MTLLYFLVREVNFSFNLALMISSSDAISLVLEERRYFGTERIDFSDSLGRILAEDIRADRDFPPFHRVMMDGVALNYASLIQGRRSFLIHSIQAAGQVAHRLEDSNGCIEIMTGAVLPLGTDTVIRYEDIDISEARASLKSELSLDRIKQGQNVHPRGSDKSIDDVLIKASKKISSADIGILATVGASDVLVKKLPRVAIISTGDELVDVKETPLDHQIRMSNSYSVSSVLKSMGIQARIFHLKDDKKDLKIKIAEMLSEYDVLIFSGAVSKGAFDFLPEVLEELSVEKLFHKVRQRPGKPLWFGRHIKGPVVFGLPGNPVSTYMCTIRYVHPWLLGCLGAEEITDYARLIADFSFNPELTYYLPVSTYKDEVGTTWAKAQLGQGSADLANLSLADGFIELPAEMTAFKKGATFPLYRF